MGPQGVTPQPLWSGAIDVAETTIVAILFTALLLGVTVGVVAAPGVTAWVVNVNSTWRYTGLSPAATVRLADATRAWVVSDRAGTTDDAPIALSAAFAPDEVSHLKDVRDVMASARLATGLAAALLTIWLVASLVVRRWASIKRGLFWGGSVALGLVALLAIASLVDFSAAFTAFHGLFFKAGTWEFPPDSMLIRVFPGGFWMTAGALWGGLTALGAVALILASRTLPSDDDEAQRVVRSYDERRTRREADAVSKRG